MGRNYYQPSYTVNVLTENDDDLFDEVMNTGENLGTAFDCYCNYDHHREDEPRHKPNE